MNLLHSSKGHNLRATLNWYGSKYKSSVEGSSQFFDKKKNLIWPTLTIRNRIPNVYNLGFVPRSKIINKLRYLSRFGAIDVQELLN